ncbi:MAG: S-methyl-5-thioribose-1-phosphate isomerase [Denitrovibrio sp.]|nr:MAG: S-methyl-5-thioribose-1-phosphate isomerase [Denitrovibrio sp.]
MSSKNVLPKTMEYKNGDLYLIDQTRLPNETIIEKQVTIEQVWDSIKVLKVRGAPAIGIAGAYGLLYGVRDILDAPVDKFMQVLKEKAAYLDSSRPTAVNLSWGLKRMVAKAETCTDMTSEEIYKVLEQEAIAIHEEDKILCKKMGENGAPLIKEGMGVLTHCNAGSLATSELGTATAPMYTAHNAGVKFRVYSDETRPLLQGARLTSWELQKSGIDVTLICDNMAAHIMSQGLIDMVIVGTDRVAANGDVANKIGTMGVAILAKHFGIPFYVACPSSTVDLNTPTGADIVIEEREPNEVCNFGARRTAPEGMKVRNPAFDVTPNELVTGIITELGILQAPYIESLASAYKK